MRTVRYTLHGDGPTDRALLPILSWVLKVTGQVEQVVPQWADLGRMPRPPRGLAMRIGASLDLYPCDLLFVHRDAEAQNPQLRFNEIREALNGLDLDVRLRMVPVVPIRMTEAWLLTDEAAIRQAAGNPNGTIALDLPPPRKLEALPDPKQVLLNALQRASGLHGRQLKRFQVGPAYRRIGELMDDFSPLRQLSAFRALEEHIKGLRFDDP